MRATSMRSEWDGVCRWRRRSSSDLPEAGGPTSSSPRLGVADEALRKPLHSEQRATTAAEFSARDENWVGGSRAEGTEDQVTSASKSLSSSERMC